MVCTGAALLNLSANGMRGTPRQQIGSPQPQATGCTPQGWLSPQGALGRPEMVVARSPSQAGQGQCHSMPWGWRSPCKWAARVGKANVLERLWARVGGENLAGPLQQRWPSACQLGCGSRSAAREAGGGHPCLLLAHL